MIKNTLFTKRKKCEKWRKNASMFCVYELVRLIASRVRNVMNDVYFKHAIKQIVIQIKSAPSESVWKMTCDKNSWDFPRLLFIRWIELIPFNAMNKDCIMRSWKVSFNKGTAWTGFKSRRFINIWNKPQELIMHFALTENVYMYIIIFRQYMSSLWAEAHVLSCKRW